MTPSLPGPDLHLSRLWAIDDGRAGHTNLVRGLAGLLPWQPVQWFRWQPALHRWQISLLRRLTHWPWLFVQLGRRWLPAAPPGLAAGVLLCSGVPALLLAQYWQLAGNRLQAIVHLGPARRMQLLPCTRLIECRPGSWASSAAAAQSADAQIFAVPLFPAMRVAIPAGVWHGPQLYLGGPTREYPWRVRELLALVQQFALYCLRTGQTGRVYRSRRTPAAVVEALRPLPLHESSHPQRTPALHTALAQGHIICCSLDQSPPLHHPAPSGAHPVWICEDSRSLLNEALWNGWPTLSILTRRCAPLPIQNHWVQQGWLMRQWLAAPHPSAAPASAMLHPDAASTRPCRLPPFDSVQQPLRQLLQHLLEPHQQPGRQAGLFQGVGVGQCFGSKQAPPHTPRRRQKK